MVSWLCLGDGASASASCHGTKIDVVFLHISVHIVVECVRGALKGRGICYFLLDQGGQGDQRALSSSLSLKSSKLVPYCLLMICRLREEEQKSSLWDI